MHHRVHGLIGHLLRIYCVHGYINNKVVLDLEFDKNADGERSEDYITHI